MPDSCLRRGNCFLGHAAKTGRQSELRENPDQPLGWVPLPRFHAIAIIVLKFVMIIVIALAKGKQRHEKRIARAAPCRIGLASDRMTSGVDEERAMLEHNHFCDAADEKTTERADPSVPERTEQGGQNKAHQHSEQMNMPMLPHDQRIFFEIGHVIERRLRLKLKQEPADVRVEKTFADVVRVFVVIDMFMMPTMFTCPHQHRIFKCTGAEDEREQAQWQHGAESHVREQPVITERDTEAGCGQQQCEQNEVKPINTEIPQIQRHRGQRENKRAYQERARRPIDAV